MQGLGPSGGDRRRLGGRRLGGDDGLGSADRTVRADPLPRDGQDLLGSPISPINRVSRVSRVSRSNQGLRGNRGLRSER
ncbi:hypothetical protein ASD48_13130 [Streptomyces sp. Root1310]|nr:hypothetical protein ASD48_13130 [Streptomyces sp. Root1310]